MVWLTWLMKRTLPVFALKVPVFVHVPEAERRPMLPLMIPEEAFVSAPVVVTVPEPILSVPLFWRVPENKAFPEFDPMNPVDVTLPLKVKVPEVEVTAAEEKREVRPVTVRFTDPEEMAPELVAFNCPLTVTLLVAKVEVLEVLMESRLL